ncbi:MAG: DUF11 domain-containing protein [Verrucomicrobia bacterium]|nr:DUF11 domain-containing protein [Verrucomicrobiota bacterium]
MARPHFTLVISAEQRAELGRAFRDSQAVKQRSRLQAVWLATRGHVGWRDVAQRVGCAVFTSQVWIGKYLAGGRGELLARQRAPAKPSPMLYPVGAIRTVGLPDGAQIFNSVGIFSSELIQAIGSGVVTTIKSSPGILVEKTGPEVVTSAQQFQWTVTYYNNSGEANDTTVVTDTLPAGVTFVSATDVWNAAALANGAPVNNNGKAVPTSVTVAPDGTTTLVFNIANSGGTDACRGNHAQLASTEGGTITITAQVGPGVTSGAILLDEVAGIASNSFGTTTSRDRHEIKVRNADVRVTKVAQPPPPASGDTVSYALIVANDGRVPAANVILVDSLPAGVTFVANSAQVLSPG